MACSFADRLTFHDNVTVFRPVPIVEPGGFLSSRRPVAVGNQTFRAAGHVPVNPSR